MAKDLILSIEVDVNEARVFFKNFLIAAKEKFVPSFLGVATLEFNLQLGESGFVIFVETNRQLSESSIHYIRNWCTGFQSGWNLRHGE